MRYTIQCGYRQGYGNNVTVDAESPAAACEKAIELCNDDTAWDAYDSNEIVVDNFAGGGGASLGIEWAFRRPVDIAINHDREAIAVHQTNHPQTRHYCEDVWAVDPVEVTQGRPVGLAWFSPDCKHFSKAKGGKPVEKKIRGLAWVAIKWAKTVKPRVIMLENVEEFEDWGPLNADGKPCSIRKGMTYRRWKKQLENCGYTVESRVLRACDYGAPTIRKRLFVIARRDGRPIVWPKPTHGKGKGLKPYRTAAEIIDWSIPVPSIFERKRPLAPATCRRVAKGVYRYVIDAADPFTVTTQGNKHALVTAFLAQHNTGMVGHDAREPVSTIVGKGCTQALVSSHIVKLRNNGHGQDVREPLDTVTAGGQHFGEVRAFLVKYYGTDQDPKLRDPLHTVTTKERFALVTVKGETYAIADIGMRMLQPRELFRAQGFPDTYIIDPSVRKRLRRHGNWIVTPLSKTAQVRLAGNSVPPVMSRALVEANLMREMADIEQGVA